MEKDIILIDDKSIINIAVNYEEAKSWAIEQTSKYKNLLVAEEDLPKVKEDVANLRKVAKKIDDKRKEIERNHKIQIEDTLLKLKELKGIFDNAAESLADQTKEFEEKYRNERKDKIQARIDEIIASEKLEDFSSRFSIQEKWLNKTTTKKSIEADLTLIVAEIREHQQAQEIARKQKEEKIEMVKTIYKDKVESYGFDINREAQFLSQCDYATGPAIIAMIEEAFEADKKKRDAQPTVEVKAPIAAPIPKKEGRVLSGRVTFTFDENNLEKIKGIMASLKELCITWENK